MAEQPPRAPSNLNEYARRCLEALQRLSVSRHLSIGGALGLAHYSEFRGTKDVDCWWSEAAGEVDQQTVIERLESELSQLGRVRTRRFGDVVSVDLFVDDLQVFNFQIAKRSARLSPLVDSPWPPIRLDSLEDLVASKMTALVDRGAPRDFVDIHHCCVSGLLTIDQCWALWRQRQEARGIESAGVREACEAVLLHLARIEKQRPLNALSNEADRGRAEQVREWYKREFCKDRLGLD
jgi:hypothetical protein